MKKFVTVLLCLFVVTVSAKTVYAGADSDVRYTVFGPNPSYMGTFEPGMLWISSSNVSDVGRNIMDAFLQVCRIPLVGRVLPCNYIRVANRLVSFQPNVQYRVILRDPNDHSRIIWEGTRMSGEYIRLGDDHPQGYRIYMTTVDTVLAGITWTALVREY